MREFNNANQLKIGVPSKYMQKKMPKPLLAKCNQH